MILCVTLNPAVDRFVAVGGPLRLGVNRVCSLGVRAGGKGIHAACAAKQLGHEVFVTGILGSRLASLVEQDLEADGIPFKFVRAHGEVRTNLAIQVAETNDFVEILEPGPLISAQDFALFEALYHELLPECDVVCLSGSLPPGLPDDTYAGLIHHAKARGVTSLVDTSGTALRLALNAGPTLVRINCPEAEELSGLVLCEAGDVAPILSADPLRHADVAVVSLGANGAIARWRNQGVLVGRPPEVRVTNPVGAGDCMLGGIAVAIERGLRPEDIMRFSIACGTAACATRRTGWLKPGEVALLEKDIVVSWREILVEDGYEQVARRAL